MIYLMKIKSEKLQLIFFQIFEIFIFYHINDDLDAPLSHINIIFRALYIILKINLDSLDCLKISLSIKKMSQFFAFLTFLPQNHKFARAPKRYQFRTFRYL